MAIKIMGKLIQRNNGIFKLMDAKNVSYDGTEALSVKDKIETLNNKVIYFVLKDISQGPQEYECPFIYNGIIKSISAIYKSDSNEEIIVDIEKANEDDRLLGNWSSILSDKLVLNNILNTQTYTVLNSIVNKKDIFRINILNNNINVASITVNIEIII